MYAIPIPQLGYWLGILTLAAGVPATLLGGILADYFRKKQRGGRMLYGAGLSLISAVLWLLILFTDNFSLLIPAGFLLLFMALAWLGAAAADAIEISGAHLRGLAVAVYIFAVNIFAYLIGANLIGKLNDLAGIATNPQTGITANAGMMRYTLLVCPVSCLLAAVCLWLGSRNLNKITSTEFN